MALLVPWLLGTDAEESKCGKVAATDPTFSSSNDAMVLVVSKCFFLLQLIFFAFLLPINRLYQ
jgi:hypothetical protein